MSAPRGHVVIIVPAMRERPEELTSRWPVGWWDGVLADQAEDTRAGEIQACKGLRQNAWGGVAVIAGSVVAWWIVLWLAIHPSMMGRFVDGVMWMVRP